MLPFFGLTILRAFVVTLSGRTITASTTSPADCTSGFRLGTDGKIYRTDTGGSGTFQEIAGLEWLDPKDALEADRFECFATVTAGALTSGVTGSWLALSSDREWTVTRTNDTTGTDTATITLSIRRIGMSTNLASASITINATVTV